MMNHVHDQTPDMAIEEGTETASHWTRWWRTSAAISSVALPPQAETPTATSTTPSKPSDASIARIFSVTPRRTGLTGGGR